MRTTQSIIRTAAVVLTITLGALRTSAVTNDAYESTTFKRHNLNGPRMGMSAVLAPDSTVQARMKNNDIGTVTSLFGWHFEWLIAPQTVGPAFVIQTVAMIGGVEYGVVLPSVSGMMGIRMPGGVEFGMGPQFGYSGAPEEPVTTSIVMAVGHSFDYSGVSIPLNLAYTRNKNSNRLSFVFGYALKRN